MQYALPLLTTLYANVILFVDFLATGCYRCDLHYRLIRGWNDLLYMRYSKLLPQERKTFSCRNMRCINNAQLMESCDSDAGNKERSCSLRES